MPNFGLQIRNIGQFAQSWVTGLQQQLYQAPGAAIEGVKPGNWPSPMQPVRPFGGADAQPLGIRIIQAMNQTFTPRPGAVFTAADLQKLAKYPLAEMCINGVCDAIGDANWTIDPKPLPGETKANRATAISRSGGGSCRSQDPNSRRHLSFDLDRRGRQTARQRTDVAGETVAGFGASFAAVGCGRNCRSA
jgi:hypothetical protein